MSTDTRTANPVSAAWRWSVRHSPIMGVWRELGERVRRHRHAAALIEASDLPAPVRERVSAIVRRTRLHASEQRSVARELLAHAHDAMEDAKPESEVLASLGDPRPISRLIRRAVKRRRPLLYQIRRWTARALLASLAFAFVLYLALVVRYNTGAPSVKTDYYARLNAHVRALADDEKAWPVYRSVLSEWAPLRDRLAAETRVDANDPDAPYFGPGIDYLADVPKDHPDFDATVEAIRSFRPTLDRAIEASSRPGLGVLFSDRTRRIDIAGTDRWFEEPIEPTADPAEQQTLLFALLPHLGEARTLARLLAFDLRVALDERDADRVYDDIVALLGVSRQLQQQPTLISSLVAIAVHELAMRRISLVIHEAPNLLFREQLAELSHRIAANRDTTLTLDLRTERLAFEDLLQRTFTDDGRGDGRLTPEGARLMSGFFSPPEDFGVVPNDQLPWLIRSADALAMPVVGVTVASRAQQSDLHAQIVESAERALAAGPASIAGILGPAEERLTRINSRETAWYPLAPVIPAFDTAVLQVFTARASADGTLALLAAAAYRADHARWPETLEELVPEYLPRIPDDPFADAAYLRYRLEADGPRLWFTGADSDDDEGRAPSPASQLRPGSFPPNVRSLARRLNPAAEVPDADWVLFPPQDD